MSVLTRRRFAALSAGVLAPALGFSQTKRLDTAKILVAFPPGGTTDQIARLLAEQLRGEISETVVVENRPGAAGRIAVQSLKQAPADGATLLIQALAIQSLYPHTYKQLGYEPFGDVSCVSTAAQLEFCMAVGPSVPVTVKTMKDYAAWVRQEPASRGSYATPGPGNPLHFMPLFYARMERLDLNPVHYRGTSAAIPDLIGGQIPAACTPLNDGLAFARDGKVRILATSGPRRNKFTQQVPTFAELGYPQLTFTDYYAVYVHAKTPAALQERYSAAVRKALAVPVVVQGFTNMYLDPVASTPAEALQMARVDHDTWARLVKELGYQPE